MATFASKASRLITVKTDGTDFFDYGGVELPVEIVDASDLFVVNVAKGTVGGDGTIVISQWMLVDTQADEGVPVSLTRPSTAVLHAKAGQFALFGDPTWWAQPNIVESYPRWNWKAAL